MVVLVLDKQKAAAVLTPLLAALSSDANLGAPPFAPTPGIPPGGTTNVPVPSQKDELDQMGVSEPHPQAEKAAQLQKKSGFYDDFSKAKAQGL